MVISWFGHLTIITYLFILILEKVYGPAGPQLEISSKEAWKDYTLFGQKHTFGSGVPRALTKKINPLLFLHSRLHLPEMGPPRRKWAGAVRQRKPRNENLEYRFHYHCTGAYFHCHFWSIPFMSLEVAEDKAKNWGWEGYKGGSCAVIWLRCKYSWNPHNPCSW